MAGLTQTAVTISDSRTLYGYSDLVCVFSDCVECRLHRTVFSVLGSASAAVPGVCGKHPAVVAANVGDAKCLVAKKVLRLDREFARAAVLMTIPGFAYNRKNGLSEARRFAGGAVLGVAAFGRGYCYQVMVRPGFRMRVARVLGPVALLSDVLAVVRLAGEFQVAVVVERVSEGLLHLRPGGPVRMVADVVHELVRFLEAEPKVRVGLEYPSCDKCGFPMKPGHESRCRIPVSVDVRRALIGDAAHMLDVKMAVVGCLPPETQFTVVSQRFCSNAAQHAYLREFYPEVLWREMSDHSAGSLFEERYCGEFRRRYVCWLLSELGRCDEAHVSWVMCGPSVFMRGVEMPPVRVFERRWPYWVCVCCPILPALVGVPDDVWLSLGFVVVGWLLARLAGRWGL